MRLKEDQLQYLLEHFDLSNSTSEALKARGSSAGLPDREHLHLLDQIADRLQRTGLDSQYKPTEAGRMLESLADAFRAPKSE